MPIRDRAFYEREYENNERSIYDIAESEGTYPNKIRREMKTLGYQLRTKSEAQSVAIKHGRHQHPTKGMKRTKEVRERISEAMAGTWQAMQEAERTKRSEMGKTQWGAMSPEQREAFKHSAAKAVRRASKEGSKLEQYLKNELFMNGYKVNFHAEAIVTNAERLQVDLYLPDIGVCIEVDGPSHFLPIWGEKNLKRKQDADAMKNTKLVGKGFVMIRVKHMIKTVSEIQKRNLLSELLTEINKAADHPPQGEGWLVEIEIK